jgi:hypothetical protein
MIGWIALIAILLLVGIVGFIILSVIADGMGR